MSFNNGCGVVHVLLWFLLCCFVSNKPKIPICWIMLDQMEIQSCEVYNCDDMIVDDDDDGVDDDVDCDHLASMLLNI